jgi:hypothetical protein
VVVGTCVSVIIWPGQDTMHEAALGTRVVSSVFSSVQRPAPGRAEVGRAHSAVEAD